MTRYQMTVEYHGAGYAGWQRQKNVPSVQAEIERSITAFSAQTITIHAAGRTDAGVHALGQVIHFNLEPLKIPMQASAIAKAINAHLRPHPIVITHAQETDPDFHARFHATNKLYRYRIVSRTAPLATEKGLAWLTHRPLDEKAMHAAAQHLIGHHDFSTFRASECQAHSPMRTLNRLDITARAYDNHGGKEIWIEAEAQSFLHHQMRNIAGTLHLVGEGKWTPDTVKTALAAADRTQGGPTAPPDGLYLMRIDYP